MSLITRKGELEKKIKRKKGKGRKRANLFSARVILQKSMAKLVQNLIVKLKSKALGLQRDKGLQNILFYALNPSIKSPIIIGVTSYFELICTVLLLFHWHFVQNS